MNDILFRPFFFFWFSSKCINTLDEELDDEIVLSFSEVVFCSKWKLVVSYFLS